MTRSSKHITVQLVDDLVGKTLASASTMEADVRTIEGDKTAKARKVGELVAERAKSQAWLRWSSTGPATSTTVASRPSRTAPARAA